MATRKKAVYLLALLLFMILPFPAKGEEITIQFFGGFAYNFSLPLVIRQEGKDNIRLSADYDTKPFDTPIYWSLRAGKWGEKDGWEIELLHHKLYLKNNPPEVEHFTVTHGFNLLTLNRAWKRANFIWRAGAGVVVAHPESAVRGKTFSQEGGLFEGYYLAGPTLQVAVEKRFPLFKSFFLCLEGKYTLSWAHIPVEEGKADLWNSAIHGLIGLGYNF